MRILVVGFIVFVIWSFFSTWLYVSKILPVLNGPVIIQTIPEKETIVEDSLIQKDVSPPENLMIFFEFDKATFKADSQIDMGISEFKKWMENSSSAMISVIGHTDFTGTQKYNYSLGVNRAMAVKSYLEGKGIPSDRMNTTSKGELEPIGDNHSKEGRAMNRRAEIKIKMQ